MPASTHYEILGVPPAATSSEVREAYRRLAREHHPDRAATSGVGADSMSLINEAYRVLSDPARRAVYDAGLRDRVAAAPTSDTATPSTDRPRGDVQRLPAAVPARFPWRSLLVVGVFAIVGLVVIAQVTEPGQPPGPDGIVRIGGCVSLESNGFARDAHCTGDPTVDVVVEDMVAFGAACPMLTTGYQDRQGLGVVCVVGPVDVDE